MPFFISLLYKTAVESPPICRLNFLLFVSNFFSRKINTLLLACAFCRVSVLCFTFNSSIDTVAENFFFHFLFCYFCKYLFIVYVMIWNFFSELNFMIKESNVNFFPLQNTNIENSVQIQSIVNIVHISANQIANIFSC